MQHLLRSITVATLMSLVAGGTVLGAVTPAEKCAETKQKAAAKKVSAKLKCYANAAKKGAAFDLGECLSKADTKFSAAFAKAQALGGCVNDNDAASVENGVDEFVSYLLTATSQRPCSSAILGLCGGSCPLGLRCVNINPGGLFPTCSCSF